MYSITYGDDLLYDPLDADAYPVSDVSLSAEINGSGSCEFSITKTHPLYDVIDLYDTDRLVTVTEDSHILFKGYVASVDEDEYGVRTYSCTGILSFLKKSVVRPYSTDAEDEKHVKAPSTIDGFFNWLISEHDNHTDRRKRFIVGRNEGDIVRRENVIHASSDSASTTANVLQSELLDGLGGYVFVRYGDDGVTYLDYLSECRDTNAQIIDFGVNLVSYSRTDDATDVATVCYAKGGTPEKDEGSDEEKPPVDLTKYPDGPFARGSYRFEKSGDRIICLDLVDKYGYSEMTFEDSDLLDPYELLDSAAIALLKQLEPKVTIDIRAIDLSLFMYGYEPLRCGELVRVRSDPNGFDSYMLVSNMDLDLESPENTEYTLGTTFDAFTGESNKIIRQLNATINKSVDQVTALDQTTKDQAIEIGKAQEAADNAQQSANNAQQTADNAQQTANSNKDQIDTIKDKQSEQDEFIEKLQQGIADSEADISGINGRIDGMNSEIESAKSDIDSLRSSTETELQNVKQSVSDVQSDVDAVTQKASDLASDLDGTKATVEQVTTDLGEVKTTVSNAATKADQALQVSTSASQTATEAKTTATSAYQDAQSALTQSSTASQTANAVKTELETKYSTTDEIAEQYATKSLVEQTSQSITSTVEATYATKATVEALENIANNAVQTWMGSGVPTLSNKPASDWTTAELKSQHSGDIYYDSDTGYSYRFGSSDGSSYSWSLIKDTDIAKAVADAAKAQQTAEGVSDEVTQLKTDIPATYATKTEVKQTTDSIKSTVSEVATTANSALSKATTVEQTANGLQTTVTEQAEKLDGAVTTISQVSQKVDSVSSTITQVQGDIDRIDANSQNFITNPQFKQGNADGVSNTNMNATDSNPGVLPGTATTFGKNFSGYDNRAENVKIKFIKNHTYRIEIDARLASENTYTGNDGLGLFFWFMAADNPGLSKDQYTGYNSNLIPMGTKEWMHASYDYTPTMGDDDPRIIFRPAYRVAPSSRWLVTNFTCTDVTAIAEAQKDADTANSTANSALSQSSTVQQELTSFKTSVQQTYETKNDALSKQSSLQQSVNNLRTEVSETYTTKTEFDALEIGGTNLIQNSDFSRQGEEWAFGVDGVTAEYGTDVSMGTYVKALGSSSGNRRFYQEVKDVWHKGEKLVYSFYAKSDDDTPPTIDLSRSLTDYGQKHTLSNTWTRYTGSITATATPGTGTLSIRFVNTGAQTALITKIKLERGTKATDWSPAPEDMLSTAEAAQTYSTKSYVDQTARTVSLGVVEEYKDGQHGSALATQSDITAAKDSITSTVSQTYATKNDVGVGNLIKNGDFSDGLTNWTTVSGTSKIVDGTYGKQFVFTQTGTNTNGNNRIYNPSYNHINGQAYEVSFYAKADKSSTWHFGPTGSSKAASATLDATLKQYTMQYQAEGTTVLSIWTDNPTATIYLERVKLSVASGYYATKTEVTQTSDALTVKINSAASAASTAQSTANTANTNATNANNRVGNLETCIKMTSDGVRVGKIENGDFTGYSALVNSEGSFDILDSSSKTLAFFNKDGLSIKSSSDRGMFVGFDSAANSGYIGSTPKVVTSEGGKAMDIGMNMSFDSGGYLNIINNLGGIGIVGRGVQLTATGNDRVKIGVMDVRGAGVVLFDRDDGNNYSVVNITIGYNFSEFNYIMCFFKTNDGQYFGGTAYHPNGKEYCFTTMGGGAGSTDMSYLKGTRWVFDGTKATRKTTFEIGPGYSTAVNDAVMHIVAIVGFDYYKTSG